MEGGSVRSFKVFAHTRLSFAIQTAGSSLIANPPYISTRSRERTTVAPYNVHHPTPSRTHSHTLHAGTAFPAYTSGNTHFFSTSDHT
jgi:hypothetical protein